MSARKGRRGPKRAGILLLALFVFMGFSCSREVPLPEEPKAEKEPLAGIPGEAENPLGGAIPGPALPDDAARDAIAEIERSGGFTRGMGLTESVLRENAGDYGGAVMAAYKELSWIYSYGETDRDALTEGLRRILRLYGEDNSVPEEKEKALLAARGALAFLAEDWAGAEEVLGPLFAAEEEPDAFSRWMLLVCALEGGDGSRATRMAYGAIRARYLNFPEYWYRGARSFPGNAAAEYAERCINLSPQGPFAPECRAILAVHAGLDNADGEAIRSAAEIDTVITESLALGKTELLAELFPLIALPDNPYTLYASGALRGLAASEPFKSYFASELRQRSGRLAERLRYISRG
jgi:hypothetical protein